MSIERLTQRCEDGNVFYPECFALCGGVGCKQECDNCEHEDERAEKLATYEDAEEQGKLQLMDCTGCKHKGNKQFCLNCRRGGCRDYFLVE